MHKRSDLRSGTFRVADERFDFADGALHLPVVVDDLLGLRLGAADLHEHVSVAGEHLV